MSYKFSLDAHSIQVVVVCGKMFLHDAKLWRQMVDNDSVHYDSGWYDSVLIFNGCVKVHKCICVEST